MNLLAIFGSPRANGNTDLMLEAFLEGASSVKELGIERIYVRKLTISGCLGCGYCDEKGVCVQTDDMNRVYPLLDSADRVVVATPVYFYSFPGQLKLLIDRTQAPFMRNLKEKEKSGGAERTRDRKGFLLSAGATRGKRLFECTVLGARYFFDALDIAYSGELCFREVDKKGDIRLHPTALEDCRRAGMEFVGKQ